MTNTIKYARDCEVYSAGACNWKLSGREFHSLNEDGRPMSASKCIYDVGGPQAEKDPNLCRTRQIILSLRQAAGQSTATEKSVETIANTA